MKKFLKYNRVSIMCTLLLTVIFTIGNPLLFTIAQATGSDVDISAVLIDAGKYPALNSAAFIIQIIIGALSLALLIVLLTRKSQNKILMPLAIANSVLLTASLINTLLALRTVMYDDLEGNIYFIVFAMIALAVNLAVISISMIRIASNSKKEMEAANSSK